MAGWLGGQVQEAYSVGLRVLMVLLGSWFSWFARSLGSRARVYNRVYDICVESGSHGIQLGMVWECGWRAVALVTYQNFY